MHIGCWRRTLWRVASCRQRGTNRRRRTRRSCSLSRSTLPGRSLPACCRARLRRGGVGARARRGRIGRVGSRRRRHCRLLRSGGLGNGVIALQWLLVRSGGGRVGRCGGRGSVMPHGVSHPEAHPAKHQQPQDETEHRARAECQLGVASRPLRLRFIFVEVSAHEK